MHPISNFHATQRGIALFAALIALVVMMIAAVALIRSTDTAQQIAGNLAIKRDLTHESELAVRDALKQFNSGGNLATETARQANVSGVNYYASAQASNPVGIPTALIGLAPSSDLGSGGTGITYTYMIDRMCPAAGSSVGAHCVLDPNQEEKGSQAIDAFAPLQNAGTGAPTASSLGDAVVYRISVRVKDARGAESFFQSTLAVYNGGI